MNSLRKKLRGNRGASITFALLLFLVCTMVSSVVIVAASTAGGRLSGVRESDQRYYAVTAAADVLRETLVGDSNAIIVTYTADDAGEPKSNTVATDSTGMTASVSKWLFGGTALAPITITPDPIDSVSYTCTITPSLENGLLRFDIACTGGKVNASGKYTLQASFSSNIQDSETDPATKAHRAKVTWKFIGLRKIKTTGGAATP